MATQLTEGLAILFVVVVSVLSTATVAVVAVTVLCVLRCRRGGSVGARLLGAAWGLALLCALGYAWTDLHDMTLDPAKGDFWWSAWVTIAGLGNALAALGGASFRHSRAAAGAPPRCQGAWRAGRGRVR